MKSSCVWVLARPSPSPPLAAPCPREGWGPSAPCQGSGSGCSPFSPQSLDDAELQLLGRTHSARDALRTLAAARRLFPGRVSVDLMLGLPGQQLGPWLGQLRELLRHCDDHLSLYQLSLERGTALFAQVQRGAVPAPDPELAAEMYAEGRALLRTAGFRQYEVSNFARRVSWSPEAEGAQSLTPTPTPPLKSPRWAPSCLGVTVSPSPQGALSTHNWTYWQCGQYLGVGPGESPVSDRGLRQENVSAGTWASCVAL